MPVRTVQYQLAYEHVNVWFDTGLKAEDLTHEQAVALDELMNITVTLLAAIVKTPDRSQFDAH